MIYGVDVSSWQGYPNWPLLKSEGHDFMISKVTGEGHYINPYAATNIQRARTAGFIVGGYDWCQPQMASTMTGAQMARDFLRVLDAIGARQPTDLLAVDFEDPEWYTGPLGRNIEPLMREYFYTLRDEGGQPVICYTGDYYLKETGANGWAWLGKDFLFWQAAPGAGMLPDDSPWPANRAPFASTLLHQHQWHATSAAVVGTFDRNRFQGTREQLAAYGRGGAPQEGEVKEPAAGMADQYLNAKGELIAVINFGGEATEILGVNYADVGGSVRNKKRQEYDITLRNGVMGPWNLRPKQDQG